jgi:tetratricopeptide (TPR) repeat protein
MVSNKAAFFLFLVASQAWAAQAIQELTPADPGPVTLQNAPLDPARRGTLEAAIKSRDYTRAETLLLEDIGRNPKSPQLLTLLGSIFFMDGKYLNAAIAMKKAEALNPLDDRSRFTLAMSYVTLNRRDWARPELEKLAQRSPQNALYPYWLARLDYDEMQFGAAVTKLQRAIQIDPNFMKAYDNLGLCYEALGNHDEAVRTYQDAIRLNRQKNPSSPWPPLNLGALLIKLGRLEEAESILQESLRYDPKFPQAHCQLGILLEKQKKDTEAIQELNQAAALDPSYPEPHYVLGRIYRRIGDGKNAQMALSTFERLKKGKRPERP